MLAKLSTLALALPLVSALTINTISDTPNDSSLKLTWSSSSSDAAYFSVELVNQADFHSTFALANNVETSLGSYTLPLPAVQQGQYQIEAIATDNITDVFAISNTFTITASSNTTSSASTSGTSTGTASSGTAASTGTSTASGSSASSSASSSSSSGATSLKLVGVVPAAAFVLSTVAGAAMVL